MHEIVARVVEAENSFGVETSMTCNLMTGLVLIDSAIKNYAMRFDLSYDVVLALLNKFNREVIPQAVIDVDAIKRQLNKD